MTETQLDLGNELLRRIQRLEQQRIDYKNNFDENADLIKQIKEGTDLHKKITGNLTLIEKRIQSIDKALPEVKQKFKQL
jgi:hypothetical protein